MASRTEGNKMKTVLGVVSLTLLSGCATINETWDDAMYRITSAECKLFKAEQYGKCMREHYPRVEEDYSWEKKDDVGSNGQDKRDTPKDGN
jgi:hypothetical protein